MIEARDPQTIYHWVRLDARVTTSGQPNEEQLAGLAAAGVKHVINLALHTHEKALPDEAASVAALGMAYSHIPVDFSAPTEADFEAFVAAFDATKGDQVHVHCIANYRVTAFFYRYYRDVLSLGETKARAAMDAIWQPEGVWAAFIK
jgi:protein tyrosine phosphatase (PTP) superfamily phosphohydrolase (DUF442 family)